MNNAIRLLHICRDDKFLKDTISGFSKMTDSVVSEYVILKQKNEKLKYVIENELTVFTNRKSFKEKLRKGDYDAVYLHSFPPENYWVLRCIPKDKIIIWWAWGYDIYNGGIYGWKSYIKTNSIKKETKKIQNQSRSVVRKILLFLCMLYYELFSRMTRQMVLKRIDYFRPVLPAEYELMRYNKGFRAEEYYPLIYGPYVKVKNKTKRTNGSIIIGNSASAFNNHVDVWLDIKKNLPVDRNVIVPLSYGTDRYAKKVKTIFAGENVRFLDDFLPREEYFDIMDNCSYAVYGSMRQHAIGNIIHALSEGMKVFLYKDSIVFKSMKDMGFVVFAIEEMDNQSLNTPLNKEDLAQNEKAFDAWKEHCTIVKTKAMDELRMRTGKK